MLIDKISNIVLDVCSGLRTVLRIKPKKNFLPYNIETEIYHQDFKYFHTLNTWHIGRTYTKYAGKHDGSCHYFGNFEDGTIKVSDCLELWKIPHKETISVNGKELYFDYKAGVIESIKKFGHCYVEAEIMISEKTDTYPAMWIYNFLNESIEHMGCFDIDYKSDNKFHKYGILISDEIIKFYRDGYLIRIVTDPYIVDTFKYNNNYIVFNNLSYTYPRDIDKKDSFIKIKYVKAYSLKKYES